MRISIRLKDLAFKAGVYVSSASKALKNRSDISLITKNKIKLKKKITETHPYDVPEIAEIDVTSINKSYLNWLIESTN